MFKQILKFIFGIIVIALAIYGGIFAWFQIKAIEDIHQTDIYKAIPATPDMMLIVHKPAQLPEVWNVGSSFSNLLPEEKSLMVIDAIGKSQICSERCIDKEPLAICYYPEGTLLFSKMKRKDFDYMERKFFRANLSGFAPKKEMYKNAEIRIKATNGEDFFCYTLFHNIFIGSFKKGLVYKAIDAYIQQSGLRNDSTSEKTMSAFDNFDQNTLAGLYLKDMHKSFIFKELASDTLNHWLTGDIRIKDQIIEISGFLPVNQQDTLSVTSGLTYQMIAQDTSYVKHYFSENVVDSILSPLKTGTEYEQNPAFQTIFNENYDKDVHQIIWMRKNFYNFLLFISPNHTDKFYSLSILKEP